MSKITFGDGITVSNRIPNHLCKQRGCVLELSHYDKFRPQLDGKIFIGWKEKIGNYYKVCLVFPIKYWSKNYDIETTDIDYDNELIYEPHVDANDMVYRNLYFKLLMRKESFKPLKKVIKAINRFRKQEDKNFYTDFHTNVIKVTWVRDVEILDMNFKINNKTIVKVPFLHINDLREVYELLSS